MMNPEVQNLLQELRNKNKKFGDVLTFIDSQYIYSPSGFQNGNLYNEISQNQGSAKVFSFAKLEDLNQEDTLTLFAEHYQAVLDDPHGEAHQNIRQFMQHGWDGIRFDSNVLVKK